MHTAICDELGIEFPIFAFTHCRDVVVAVSKAGGFGVLGAVGFTPSNSRSSSTGSTNIGDHPYGVDIVIPNKYEGMDSHLSAEELAETLRKMVPQEHLDFAKKILADHGVPSRTPRGHPAAAGLDGGDRHPPGRDGAQASEGGDDRQRARHSAADMIKHIHDEGRKVAALCGSPSQARKHADAGVDIVIAQGGEAGGHCGEVGSIVLWPQVVKEVAPVRCWPRVVSAAASRSPRRWRWAPRARGPSQWLMVEEASNTPVQQAAYVKASSRDTVRSRSFTGKPARMLRNDWTEAWENPDNPKPLGMPLQYMVQAWRCGPRTGSRTRPSTSPSTRSVRLSDSSPRSRRPRRSSSAGCRSTSRRRAARRTQRRRGRLRRLIVLVVERR